MVQMQETTGTEEKVRTARGIVVGHTHWDREWYLPFEGFRARLVAMMDGLIDILESDPEFKCFVLDGQTIMIDDYLEVRPEAADRVRRMVRDDRLVIGPWYTAVDTFLPDPESLVRNLQLGRWEAHRYDGEPMPVGHLPDTFGFIGQMPQLLQHFGIESAFAWRGFHPEGAGGAFWWVSPDGTRVLTLRPIEGYCEGAMGVVSPEHYMDEVLPAVLSRQNKEPYPHRLFVVGCDHFIASPRLPWLAEQIAARVGHPVEVGSIEDMVDLVRPYGDRLPSVQGEQRDPCLAVCPASVAGTRIPLKQANHQVESLMLGLAEPLHALAELTGGGSDRAHLRWGWQLLAQNHPHDSIPGCSTDEVHREMFTRFARARMVAVDASQRGAKRLSSSLDPSVRGELGAIGIVGLTGGQGRLRVRLHGTDQGRMPNFRIVAPDGQEVPYVILGRGKDFIHYHRLEDAFASSAKAGYVHIVATREWVDAQRKLPLSYQVPYADIEMEVDAPHAGYRILRIERAAAGRPRGLTREDRAASKRAEIDDEQLRVWADENGLFVERKATGRAFGPVYFSHAGEAGDEYTAYPVPGEPVVFVPEHTQARVTRDGLGERLEMPISVQVPARLKADRRTRTGRVRLDGSMAVRLIDGRAEIELELNNRARDYDLRLMAHVPGAEKARSGAPFGVEDRGFELGHSTPTAPQQWIPDFPMRGWLAAQDGDGAGLAVLARGLYEGAVRKVEGGVDLALTLLRGVGRLSREDLETRPGHAGPEILTPEAQCLGPQHWEFALLPFGPGELDMVPARTEQFLRPPAAFPVQWSSGTGPAEMHLFDGDPALVVSALKPAIEGPGAMLHAHNPTPRERQAQVSGARSRLDETPASGGGTLRPYQIAAWKFEL